MHPEMCKGDQPLLHETTSKDTDSHKTTLNTVMALITRYAMRKRGHFGRPVSVRPSVCHVRAVPAAENNTRVGLARSMASAGARAYNGGLGAGVQGAEPQVGGQGAKPPEADGILLLEHTFLPSPGGFLHFVSYSLPTVPR